MMKPELAIGEAYMWGHLTIEGDDVRGTLALLAGRRLRDDALDGALGAERLAATDALERFFFVQDLRRER